MYIDCKWPNKMCDRVKGYVTTKWNEADAYLCMRIICKQHHIF